MQCSATRLKVPLLFALIGGLVTGACSESPAPPAGSDAGSSVVTAVDVQTSASDDLGVEIGGDSESNDSVLPDGQALPSDTESSGEADTTATQEDVEAPQEDPHLSVLSLGQISLDPTTGLSEPLTIDVPTDAVSLAISIEGAPGVYYAVDELTSPSGGALVSTGWYMSPNNQGGHQLCIPCANRISASSGAHATLVPMSPSVSVEGGSYVFRIVAFDLVIGQIWDPPEFDFLGGEVGVEVVIKHLPQGLPPEGTLNLNLHFTGAAGLTAESAPTDPRMLEALETFETIYAQIGVNVGTITWRDIDESYSFIDGLMGPEADFEAAAAQTAGAPPGVNFIFVDEIVDSSNPLGAFGVILGVSGGIPGPIGLQGTTRSAVIVDVSPPEMAGDIPFGITMAHEMGHFLGLYHSSEMPFANLHDPLPDTAENDATNLMFFEASNGGSALSEDQGDVIRGNPWVAHSEESP